jgi:integrase
VPHRLYWSAAILLAWDSGIRRGDVWAFKKSTIRPDGAVRIVQHKTQRAISFRLRESTIQALDAIHHTRCVGSQ